MIKYKNDKYWLFVDEYNALQNITALNKMDCWFSIRKGKDKLYYIFDMEENKRIPLKTALGYIQDGLMYEDFFMLSDCEQKALNNLFKMCGFEEVK